MSNDLALIGLSPSEMAIIQGLLKFLTTGTIPVNELLTILADQLGKVLAELIEKALETSPLKEESLGTFMHSATVTIKPDCKYLAVTLGGDVIPRFQSFDIDGDELVWYKTGSVTFITDNGWVFPSTPLNYKNSIVPLPPVEGELVWAQAHVHWFGKGSFSVREFYPDPDA